MIASLLFLSKRESIIIMIEAVSANSIILDLKIQKIMPFSKVNNPIKSRN